MAPRPGGGQVGGLNILPKKRWHVRTRENIARVRRDEAKAAEEEKQRLERAALAEQESRTTLLRQKASLRKCTDSAVCDTQGASRQDTPKPQHVNFFAELEQQERTFGHNKDHEAEKRQEQQAAEQKIGLLRFLGEGSAQASKEKPWYEVVPERNVVSSRKGKCLTSDVARSALAKVETSRSPNYANSKAATAPSIGNRTSDESPGKRKRTETATSSRGSSAVEKRKRRDRANVHSRRRSWSSSTSSRTRSSSSSSGSWTSNQDNSNSSPSTDAENPTKSKDALNAKQQAIQRLREERISRELQERMKAEQLLRARIGGKANDMATSPNQSVKQQKYNSQFNPDISRQNNNAYTSNRLDRHKF